jgi:3-oxoacyl-[acyl-carrier protein] reductase
VGFRGDLPSRNDNRGAEMKFAGMTAVVTGGANGIGAATARRLAADGAHVVVVDLDEGSAQALAADIGGTAISCDVTQRDQVEAMIGAAAARGSVDIVVTCAGIIRDNLLFKMSDDDWDAVIETHLKGTFLTVRAAQGHMVSQRRGKIVLISSTSALGNRGQTNYATAKAGLQGMAKTLAIELGPFDINVNCVAPGFIATAMTQQTAERVGLPFDEFKERVSAEVPLRRVGEPEDVANTIAFLCSDDAAYVTGQVIYVRGGP